MLICLGARPSAEPNSGFMKQLELYHSMGCPEDLDSQPEYQRWLYRRAVEESNAVGRAPDVGDIAFASEDVNSNHPEQVPRPDAGDMASTRRPGTAVEGQEEMHEGHPRSSNADGTQEGYKDYRCRRCRYPLANSTHLLPHTAKPPPSTPNYLSEQTPQQNPGQKCSHFHLQQPLAWMRPELSEGKLEGRLECPTAKCKAQIGRYAWQGLRCSCGEWVVPGLALKGGGVDEVRSTNPKGGKI